jgi:hypothetical protein
MRWVVSVLILMNLLLAMWQVFYDKQVDATTPALQADVGDLRLLSERDPETVPTRDQAIAKPVHSAPADVPPKPLPVTPNPPAAVVKAPSHEPAPVVEQKPKAAPPVRTATARVPIEPASPPEMPKEPLAEEGVSPAQEAPPLPTEVAVTPRRPAKSCWQLPSQETREAAVELSARLPLDTNLLGIVEQTVKEENGYYVLIPAAANASQARRTVENLDAKGISDTWIFPSGDLRNAISLGLFSREQNAQARIEELAKKGVEAQIRPRFRETTGYAVQLQAPADIGLARLKPLVPGEPKKIDCP